jgi:hypothetical protein
MFCLLCGSGNQAELTADDHPFLRSQESGQIRRLGIPEASCLPGLRLLSLHRSGKGIGFYRSLWELAPLPRSRSAGDAALSEHSSSHWQAKTQSWLE